MSEPEHWPGSHEEQSRQYVDQFSAQILSERWKRYKTGKQMQPIAVHILSFHYMKSASNFEYYNKQLEIK